MTHNNKYTMLSVRLYSGTANLHDESGPGFPLCGRPSFAKALAYLDDQLNTRLSLSEVLDE
ncbi:hypothetical protein AAIA72_01050 [Hahella sp. SMD15-11]|uniref:Uncharacterized protein n=1 Tax=Thermohahella caldifontis TaxID=3142973 RepID=A0AB39UX02_9GAMM